MAKQKIISLAIISIILLVFSGLTVYIIFDALTSEPSSDEIRVACVGDSLTQSTVYPFELWMKLGKEDYTVNNFGVGSTTVLLNSDTPYMDTPTFQEALDFKPDIVIIMMGTNDAQPSLHPYNASFVGDYLELVYAFQNLSNKPEIWIVFPPPIFGDKGGTISPEYFADTLIPRIQQVANQTNLPTIDVYSALADASDYFPDGLHPTDEGGRLIAAAIYDAIT